MSSHERRVILMGSADEFFAGGPRVHFPVLTDGAGSLLTRPLASLGSPGGVVTRLTGRTPARDILSPAANVRAADVAASCYGFSSAGAYHMFRVTSSAIYEPGGAGEMAGALMTGRASVRTLNLLPAAGTHAIGGWTASPAARNILTDLVVTLCAGATAQTAPVTVEVFDGDFVEANRRFSTRLVAPASSTTIMQFHGMALPAHANRILNIRSLGPLNADATISIFAGSVFV